MSGAAEEARVRGAQAGGVRRVGAQLVVNCRRCDRRSDAKLERETRERAEYGQSGNKKKPIANRFWSLASSRVENTFAPVQNPPAAGAGDPDPSNKGPKPGEYGGLPINRGTKYSPLLVGNPESAAADKGLMPPPAHSSNRGNVLPPPPPKIRKTRTISEHGGSNGASNGPGGSNGGSGRDGAAKGSATGPGADKTKRPSREPTMAGSGTVPGGSKGKAGGAAYVLAGANGNGNASGGGAVPVPVGGTTELGEPEVKRAKSVTDASAQPPAVVKKDA